MPLQQITLKPNTGIVRPVPGNDAAGFTVGSGLVMSDDSDATYHHRDTSAAYIADATVLVGFPGGAVPVANVELDIISVQVRVRYRNGISDGSPQSSGIIVGPRSWVGSAPDAEGTGAIGVTPAYALPSHSEFAWADTDIHGNPALLTWDRNWPSHLQAGYLQVWFGVGSDVPPPNYAWVDVSEIELVVTYNGEEPPPPPVVVLDTPWLRAVQRNDGLGASGTPRAKQTSTRADSIRGGPNSIW